MKLPDLEAAQGRLDHAGARVVSIEQRAELVLKPEPYPDTDGSIQSLLATKAPRRKWHTKDRLLAGRGHLLTGVGGSSKTILLYHLAVGSILGRLPWSWEIEQQGSALLFLAEDTEHDLHETLQTFCDVLMLTKAERNLLGEKLHIWAMAGTDTRLLSVTGGGIYENAKGLGLIERCKQFEDAVFIGLDPALGLTEGNELDQAHQRYLGQYVDKIAIQTGACAVLASHATKASANAEELHSHQSRGGGGITDAVRGEFVLRTMTAKEAKQFGVTDLEERKRHVQLVATKGNRLPPDAYVPTWLCRGPGGTLSAANLREVETDAIPKLNEKDLKVLAVLKELYKTNTPSMAAWRENCIERHLLKGDTSDAISKNMDRIRDRLKENGLIEKAIQYGAYVPTFADETEE